MVQLRHQVATKLPTCSDLADTLPLLSIERYPSAPSKARPTLVQVVQSVSSKLQPIQALTQITYPWDDELKLRLECLLKLLIITSLLNHLHDCLGLRNVELFSQNKFTITRELCRTLQIDINLLGKVCDPRLLGVVGEHDLGLTLSTLPLLLALLAGEACLSWMLGLIQTIPILFRILRTVSHCF